MSGQDRRTPPRSGWSDPTRPNWSNQDFVLAETTLGRIAAMSARVDAANSAENHGPGVAHSPVPSIGIEVRLHGELLEKYRAGEMRLAELEAIAAIFTEAVVRRAA